jgi:transcriptional regulator of arginine metabolism
VSSAAKAARQAQITKILARTVVHSQEELAELLAQNGVKVAQTTLSRDLEELGVNRVRGSDRTLRYALPGERDTANGRPGEAFRSLARVAGELLQSIESSGNLVVLRTTSGGAQLLASAIDRIGWTSILGTVAGDDTVLVVTRDLGGGKQVELALRRLVADKL